jgi:polysaccharide export outer membrane protein
VLFHFEQREVRPGPTIDFMVSRPVALLLFAAASALSSPNGVENGQASPSPAFTVLVSGEVRYPGRATLTASTMTVPDALAAVGSPTGSAGDEVTVIRISKSGAAQERRTINIKDMEQGKAGVDVTLEDGDIVNVPLAKRFFISGLVKRPASYKWSAGTTVSQAIVMVGGLTEGGTTRRIRIGRVVNGKTVEVSARPGDTILPNDEITIQRRMF